MGSPVFSDNPCRIGEANNPGPYTEGGASSSSSVLIRGDDECRPSEAPLLTIPKAEVRARSRFDDVEDWTFGQEEEYDCLPQDHVAFGTETGDPMELDRCLNVEEALCQVDVDLQLLREQSAPGRQMDIEAPECWPALVEGLVELPSVEEEVEPSKHNERGFRTREGWWVSDPLSVAEKDKASHRAQLYGLSGHMARSSDVQLRSPIHYAKSAWREFVQREKLAQLADEALPNALAMEEASQRESVEDPSQDKVREVENITASPAKPRKKRGKGRRQRAGAADTVSIWTFNSSGAPQLRAAVSHCRACKGDVPVAILCQEHHAGAEQLADLQAQVRKDGWRIAASHATQTAAGGWSAGVGICTPAHVAAGVDGALGAVDCSPVGSPGRVAALWIQQVAPGGIVLLSCYLHDVEHGSVRNAELLARALEVARSSCCPWIIGLDGQEEPCDLLRWAAPMIDRANGTLVHPDAPTHVPGAGVSRCMDYFILDKALADAVGSIDLVSEIRCHSSDADYTVTAKPHKAVRLTLKRNFSPLLIQTLRLPRSFPRNKPIGCARRPVQPDDPSELLDQKSRGEFVSNKYGKIVEAIESELKGVCDLLDDSYRGRAKEASVVARPSLPRRAAGPRGAMAQREFANVWGLNRIKELLALSSIYMSKGRHTPSQKHQWQSLIRKVCSPSAPVACTQEVWDRLVQELQSFLVSPGEAAESLQQACLLVGSIVQAETVERKRRRQSSWKQWKQRQCQNGEQGGALFAYLRRTEECPDLVVRCLGVRSASPQATVDEDYKVWNALWSKLSHLSETPWRSPEKDEVGPALRPLRHMELRAAAASFKSRTASGVDALLPTHFAWLSDSLLDRVGALYTDLEEHGCWPRQVSTSIVHLIPKAAGGRRPIGLLASLVRLWERARKPWMREWQGTCRRAYNWMERGRGSERSVWAQTVYEEAAVASGKTTASIFLDLLKAFEQVVLANVWRSGLKHRMPQRILALALEACAFTRRLSFRGAISQAAETKTAIIAGGGFATDLLFITLVDAVDEILLLHEKADTNTTLRAFMIVDDIRLLVEGSEECVAKVLPAVAEQAVRVLEGRLCMKVSRDQGDVKGKTVAQTSSKRLSARLHASMHRLGVKLEGKVKNLGVQFTAGANRATSNLVAVARYKKALVKVSRARKIGKRAQGKAVRQVLTPSFTYGSSAASCPVGLVKQLRTYTAQTFGPSVGRSTTARLLLEDADVCQTLVIKTLMSWVTGAWDNLIEGESMTMALRLAQTNSIQSGGRMRGVLSGAAAYLAALKKLGWSAPSFDSVRTRSGSVLYFGERSIPTGAYSADPRLVRRFAIEDYEVQSMLQSTVAKDLADLHGARGYPSSDHMAQVVARSLGIEDEEDIMASGVAENEVQAAGLWRRGRFEHVEGVPVPWLWPVKLVMKSLRKKKLYKVASSVRALIEGGWSTQFRRMCIGQAAHPNCICDQGIGTLRHKLGSCALSEEMRVAHCPEWLRRACEKECWHPLFTRGVPIRPKPVPVPEEMVWFEAAESGSKGEASGDIFTDGSARGAYWRAMRGGWSIVALDSNGRHLWTKRGILGGVNVSSHRAELRALLEVLKCAAPPLRIHIDNKGVIDGTEEGREWCTSSKTADSDLWREVWDHLERVRLGGTVEFLKVKAHTGWAELLDRKITPRQQFGNWLADLAAKSSAKHSESLSPTAGFERELTKAVAWLRWVARYANSWVQDVTQDDACPPRGPPTESITREWEYGEAFLRHELWAVGRKAMCRRCGIVMRSPEVEPREISWHCEGSAAGRAAARVTGNLNHIWAQNMHSRQSLMLRGARLIAGDPPPKWLVDSSSLHEVAHSDEHLRAMMLLLSRRTEEHAASLPPWMRAPHWMSPHLVQPWEEEEGAFLRLVGCTREKLGPREHGHLIRFSGPLVYCTKCACFAHRRLGCRFKGTCQPSVGRAASAVSSRLLRLNGGRHPITGQPLAAL